jgi:uridine kinase
MRPLIIGIAGGSGSGKSTVARRVAEALGEARVAFIDMDAYYRDHAGLSHDELRHLNWDHPDAFDLELLGEHLERLGRGEAINKPVYDFVRHRRSEETVRIEPSDVVVIDGILLLVDERVRARCDVKIFVDTEADTRLMRRIRRDMAKRGRPLEEILDQYQTTVQPMHLQFVEPSKRYADVIIPRGGENVVAIDLLLASINRRLSGGSGPTGDRT